MAERRGCKSIASDEACVQGKITPGASLWPGSSALFSWHIAAMPSSP
jgi:hypothetical protein